MLSTELTPLTLSSNNSISKPSITMNLCSHVRMKLIGFKLKFPINAFLPSFKVTTDSWVLFFRFNCVFQTSVNAINNRFHKRNVKNYLIKSRVQLQLHCGALKHTGTSIQLFEVVTNHFIIYPCLFSPDPVLQMHYHVCPSENE